MSTFGEEQHNHDKTEGIDATKEVAEEATDLTRVGLEIASCDDILLKDLENGDTRVLEELYEKLSADTLYKRFFTPVTKLDKTMVEYLADVDGKRNLAVGAYDCDGIVGVGRVIEGEAAVVVADDWQGAGVGSLLLERVTARAVEVGYEELEAWVLPGNQASMGMLRKAWPESTTEFDSGMLKVKVVF